MARRTKNSGKARQIILLLVLLGFAVSLCAVYISGELPFSLPQAMPATPAATTPSSSDDSPHSDSLFIYFPSIGNADSALLICDGKTMLIDAGTGATAKDLVAYLTDKGITKLDVVIATHPHEDHIGGMEAVLTAFPVDAFYTTYATHTTKAYQRMLEAAEAQGLLIDIPTPDMKFSLGGAECTFLTPLRTDYSELNNSSLVLKVDYGQNAILFTGDIERAAELDLVAYYGETLDCDVLKVPHHGSKTSSEESFLLAVSPDTAIVTCTIEDPPHKDVLKRYKDLGVTLYRTDQSALVCEVNPSSCNIYMDKKSDH